MAASVPAKEQADSFNEQQRRAASPIGMVRFLDAAPRSTSPFWLEQLQPPTLVLHVRGELMVRL
jgi:hypothetical protein